MAIEKSAFGQVRISNELKKKGIFISPAGVRCVWLRHDLESFKKRLKVLEEKSASEGLVLTEDQVAALEKAKEEKQTYGEIETHHPGYLGAQDTYYVGSIKGVGRIYQQTFIDTYTKGAFAKLYDRKGALVAADTLNDRVLPFFEEHAIRLLRILTDRGTEYCGAREHNEYDFTWRWKISIIQKPRPSLLKQMVSVNDCSALCRMSSMQSLLEKKSILRLRSYKQISIIGFFELTPANIALEEHRCKLLLKLVS